MDSYEDKLKALLRGLECQNIDELMGKPALVIYIFGCHMANLIKELKANYKQAVARRE